FDLPSAAGELEMNRVKALGADGIVFLLVPDVREPGVSIGFTEPPALLALLDEARAAGHFENEDSVLREGLPHGREVLHELAPPQEDEKGEVARGDDVGPGSGDRFHVFAFDPDPPALFGL